MRAEILCVGTELLLGDIINTNAAYLARELANIGVDVFYQTVVGDNGGRLRQCLDAAFARSDLVLMTGGLGPTYDDLTKETVAQHFGLPMEEDGRALEEIKCFFDRIDREMTPSNAKQALMPKGAVVFYNERGTAPGLAVSDDKNMAILLPGPPYEMKHMFQKSVLPYLARLSSRVLVSRTIRLFGVGESAVEDMLHDLMANAKNPTIAPYAGSGEMSLRVTASGQNREECLTLIEPAANEIERQLGEYIYGIDIPNLQYALVHALSEKGLKIATAESCTGGLLSQLITQIPGSSDVFDCGVCSYANDVKHKLLGVGQDTLNRHGAVSAQAAAEMARGVRELAGADIGVSTTGIAGPGGGTEEKPVGTVFVCVDTKDGSKVLDLHLHWRSNEDERNRIRNRTAQNALFAALKAVKAMKP